MSARERVGERGYLTPDNASESAIRRSFLIPNDTAWLGLVMGALAPLLKDEAWRKFGELTPEECAEVWGNIFFSVQDATPDMVDTPFWDNETDVDDEATPEEQTWFGYVLDAAVPPTGLDFFTDIGLWVITGFVAAGLGGVTGLVPALFFRTEAAKFLLKYKNGVNAGNIIRFFVDGVLLYEGVDSGIDEITDVTIIADPDMETHDIYATVEEV